MFFIPSPLFSYFHRKKWYVWMIGFVCLLATSYWFYAVYFSAKPSSTDRSRSSDDPIPVAIKEVKRANIQVYLTGLGSVTALSTATVKPRVEGELIRIHFTEGQFVKQGQLLAEIDPRPFLAQLTQAQGQLLRDEALLSAAKIDLLRYQTLLKENAIASQQVDTQQALVKQYEGLVKNDQGILAAAKLNVDYCKVTAPISGRAGLRLVDVGNTIFSNSTTGLVVITQLQPISVLFSLPEDNIPLITQPFYREVNKHAPLTVHLFDRTFKEKIATGVLSTLDNQIDPTTGTVKLRALYDNKDNHLFPNQFVNVQVLVETKHQVLSIPYAAIQYNSTGSFVFVVSPDNIVTKRGIRVGTIENDIAEVVSGLQPGEKVVVDGVDKLRDKSRVTTLH